jgi:hypothetical protein
MRTFYRWKPKYAGPEVDSVRQMAQLREENLRLTGIAQLWETITRRLTGASSRSSNISLADGRPGESHGCSIRVRLGFA